MSETVNLTRGNRLQRMGILDASDSDIADKEFPEDLYMWESAIPLNVFSHINSAPPQRVYIPLRSTVERLTRLRKSARKRILNVMPKIAYLYEIGFLVPKSQILQQAWTIYGTGQKPIIGGREIDYKELYDIFCSHLKSAIATSPNNHHVYPAKINAVVERWTGLLSEDDSGLLAYRFSEKTQTFRLCDAYLKDPESDKPINIFGLALRNSTVPDDLGKLSKSNIPEGSRLIFPFKCDYPNITDLQWDYVRRNNLHGTSAYAPVQSASEYEVRKAEEKFNEAAEWIAHTYQTVLEEDIANQVTRLAARSEYSVKSVKTKQKEIEDEYQPLLDDAMSLIRKRTVKRNALAESRRNQRRVIVEKVQARIKEFNDKKIELASLRKMKSVKKLSDKFKKADAEYVRRLRNFDSETKAALADIDARIAKAERKHRRIIEEKQEALRIYELEVARALSEMRKDATETVNLKTVELTDSHLKSLRKEVQGRKQRKLVELKFMRARLKYIRKFTSTSYDQAIDLVNRKEAYNKERIKEYNDKIRELNASLEEADDDGESKIESKIERLEIRKAALRDQLKTVSAQRDSLSRRIYAADDMKLVLKSVKSNTSKMVEHSDDENERFLSPVSKFEFYPTAFICVSPKKTMRLTKGLDKRLATLGFKTR